VAASSGGGQPSEKEPWNGEYYASFLHDQTRSWDEAVEYGFICAGGGSWYSGTLNLLEPGDRVWVNAPGIGFVGVGRVRQTAVPVSDFERPSADGKPCPALDVLSEGNYHWEFVDDPEKCEYFVAVEWADTVPLTKAVNEVGLFGNQNTVCAPKTPKWRHTVERLKEAFANFDSVE